MSGIGAIFNLDGAPVARSDLERMANALRMHGPDGRAVMARGPVGLVFTLHRFTPEDFLERQPVTGAGGRYLLVMDGRIDNREELAAALELEPQRLATLPDSALFMRAFETWGEACFNRIVGEFAMILWDAREQRLSCARDHFGLRPLAYYQTEKCIALASMPKGVFALPWVPRELNEQKLADYLILNFCDGASTYFKDVRRLLMAHVMTIGRDRGLQIRRYWNLMDAPDVRLPTDDDYVEALREKLDTAVRAHLRSATPVGAFMSGGLDSSTVAVTAAAILAERGQRLPTFTAVPEEGFDGEVERGCYADETPYVQAIARKVPNIELNLVQAEGRGLYDRMEDLMLAYEAPARNTMNLFWGNAILEQARERGIRVMLGASMGNATISHDGWALLPQLFLRGRWGTLWRELRLAPARRYPVAGPFIRHVVYPLLPTTLWRAKICWHHGLGPPWRSYSAIQRNFATALDTGTRATAAGSCPGWQPRANTKRDRLDLLAHDTAHESGDMGAAYRALTGIEERDPTGDRRLVEFCFGTPDRQFLQNGRLRWLVRRAMAGRLPPEVLDNRRTGQQAVDWLTRFARERERLTADVERFAGDGLLNRALDISRLRRAIANWPSQPVGARSELGGVVPRAIAGGRFARWVVGTND